jgi:hypothetical protein
MYINREGTPYFYSILNSLDEADRQKFLRALKREGSKVMSVSSKEITIDDYDSRNREHVDEKEIITHEMMRKAFWAALKGTTYELTDMERYSSYHNCSHVVYDAKLRRYILDRSGERRRS